MTPQHHLPADIERTSFRIITEELDMMGLTPPPEHEAVVKRVIHTTADFDYARNLRFTPRAVEQAVKALHAGAVIVTDTNMALAGVSKPGLKKLNGEALCFMADPAVAQSAKESGTTRAVAAMHKAAKEYLGAILAVGNAPTALFAIAEEIENGLRPALVIGVPVGFVNVIESKENVYDILISILKDEVRCKSFSKQFLLLDRPFGLRPYGQPGPLPTGSFGCLID